MTGWKPIPRQNQKPVDRPKSSKPHLEVILRGRKALLLASEKSHSYPACGDLEQNLLILDMQDRDGCTFTWTVNLATILRLRLMIRRPIHAFRRNGSLDLKIIDRERNVHLCQMRNS